MSRRDPMPEELTAGERILQAALRRFAVDGLSAPLRRVAADAGVSAGLIIHHYGSREKLLAACDARVLEITRREKSEVMQGGAAEMLRSEERRVGRAGRSRGAR